MSTIPTPIEETDTKPEPSKLSYELAYDVLKTIHRQELEILCWHMDRMHTPELATYERASSHAKEQVVEYYRAVAATNGQFIPGWLRDRMEEHMQGFSLELREYAFRTVEGDAAFEAAKKEIEEEEAPMNLVMELLRAYIEEAGKHEDGDCDADATNTGNTAVSSDNGAGNVDSHVTQAEADTGEAAGIGDA